MRVGEYAAGNRGGREDSLPHGVRDLGRERIREAVGLDPVTSVHRVVDLCDGRKHDGRGVASGERSAAEDEPACREDTPQRKRSHSTKDRVSPCEQPRYGRRVRLRLGPLLGARVLGLGESACRISFLHKCCGEHDGQSDHEKGQRNRRKPLRQVECAAHCVDGTEHGPRPQEVDPQNLPERPPVDLADEALERTFRWAHHDPAKMRLCERSRKKRRASGFQTQQPRRIPPQHQVDLVVGDAGTAKCGDVGAQAVDM